MPRDGKLGVDHPGRAVREILVGISGHLDTVDDPGRIHQLVAVVHLMLDARLDRNVGDGHVAHRAAVQFPAIPGVVPVKSVIVPLEPAAGIAGLQPVAAVGVGQRLEPVDSGVLAEQVGGLGAGVQGAEPAHRGHHVGHPGHEVVGATQTPIVAARLVADHRTYPDAAEGDIRPGGPFASVVIERGCLPGDAEVHSIQHPIPPCVRRGYTREYRVPPSAVSGVRSDQRSSQRWRAIASADNSA